MKQCKNCIYFKNTYKEKGKCQVLEMLETLECCIENQENECKILNSLNQNKKIYSINQKIIDDDIEFEIQLEFYYDENLNEFYVDKELGNKNLKKIKDKIYAYSKFKPDTKN